MLSFIDFEFENIIELRIPPIYMWRRLEDVDQSEKEDDRIIQGVFETT